MVSFLVMNTQNEKIQEIEKNKYSPNFKNASEIVRRYFVALLYIKELEDNETLLEKIYEEIASVND